MVSVMLGSIIELDKRRKPFVHGTVGGHTKHRRLKEKPCEECRAAFNAYSLEYKKANPEKTKEYEKISYDRIKADPGRLAARMENRKKYPRQYDYQANKEYQYWYYHNVKKLRKLENGAT